MVNIVKLRNVSSDDLLVGPLSRVVGADCLVEFAGTVVEETHDAIVVESGNPASVHAWPKATWRNETPVAKKGDRE